MSIILDKINKSRVRIIETTFDDVDDLKDSIEQINILKDKLITKNALLDNSDRKSKIKIRLNLKLLNKYNEKLNSITKELDLLKILI